MSRSAVRRLTSARSLRFSSSTGVRWPEPGKASAPSLRTAFFQVWSKFCETPSRRATSATESFCSVIIFTAASLNSGVYVLRGRAIGVSPRAQRVHHFPAVYHSGGASEGTYKVDGNKLTATVKVGNQERTIIRTVSKLTDTELVST